MLNSLKDIRIPICLNRYPNPQLLEHVSLMDTQIPICLNRSMEPSPMKNPNPNPSIINHHSRRFILLTILPQVTYSTVAQSQVQINGARPWFFRKTQMNTLLKKWPKNFQGSNSKSEVI